MIRNLAIAAALIALLGVCIAGWAAVIGAGAATVHLIGVFL